MNILVIAVIVVVVFCALIVILTVYAGKQADKRSRKLLLERIENFKLPLNDGTPILCPVCCNKLQIEDDLDRGMMLTCPGCKLCTGWGLNSRRQVEMAVKEVAQWVVNDGC